MIISAQRDSFASHHPPWKFDFSLPPIETASYDELEVHADGDATLLLLSGTPIPEPVVGYGPFVMNSRQEVETAMADFQRGKFGRMPARSAPAELLT